MSCFRADAIRFEMRETYESDKYVTIAKESTTMQLYLISDNHDTLVGLRLAGIDGVVVHTASEVRRALLSAIDNPDIGIVLLTEKLVALSPDLVYDLKLNRQRPLIVEIPDRHGSGRGSESITRYIRDAIGVKI